MELYLPPSVAGDELTSRSLDRCVCLVLTILGSPCIEINMTSEYTYYRLECQTALYCPQQ